MHIKKTEFLTTQIYPLRAAMGAAAASDIAVCIKELLKTKEEINMIFAAAPSQNEVLEALVRDTSIPWNRINAFHMDEYIGLPADAPQGFANFLKRAIFDRVAFRSVHLLDGTVPPEEEIARYSRLLREHPVDIVCMGIGENGHIAFNDPHVADFHDPAMVKVVDLDNTCRMQQVHDGCFASLDEVPYCALTLTVPTLASAKYHFCVVPAKTKAWAVQRTIEGEIGEACPATILRTIPDSQMYCDWASASLLSDMGRRWKLGAFNDEISEDLSEAADFAVRYGLDGLELRLLHGRNPFEWTDADVEEARRIIEERHLQVAAISSPLFKCRTDDAAEIARHIEGFRRCIGYCKILQCSVIRGFDFWKSGASVSERANMYRPIVELCEANNITCVLENEPTVHGALPHDVAELTDAIGSPYVKLLFDPGNIPFADGTHTATEEYNIVRNKIAHMHIKDAVRGEQGAHAVCVGTGEVNYAALSKALAEDAYDGWLCLETHYRKNAELGEAQTALPSGKDFSEGAYAASAESMEAFRKIILA